MIDTYIYAAKEGERLDEIVYFAYASYVPLNTVLRLNPDLDIILSAGEKVILPKEVKEETSESELSLW